MQYSCCTEMEYYDAVQSSGYDAIILPAAKLASMTEVEYAQIYRKMRDGNIPCNALNTFCKPELRLCGPDFDLKAVRDYCHRLGFRAGRLGVRYVGVGAPKSRSIPAGYDRKRAVEEFSRCVDAAADVLDQYGIKVLVEAVCTLECNFIVTTREAAEFVRHLDSERVGLVYDVYHAWMMQEPPEDFAEAADLVKVIHVAQDEQNVRQYLDEMGYCICAPYFREILQSGFEGEIAVEAFTPDIQKRLAGNLDVMKRLGSPDYVEKKRA